jgi:hypothetical protein
MKQPVVHAFAERVSQARLGPDLQAVYRVVGGMPSQRVDYEVKVDSVSGARAVVHDARVSPTVMHASVAPEHLDVVGLFEQISAGLYSLQPASRAIFQPDAFVGSITIHVGDNEETFYFVPEAEKRRTQGKGVAPSIDGVLQRFWEIAKAVTEPKECAKHE